MCDGAFLTREYTYDAAILREYYVNELSDCVNVEILYNVRIHDIFAGNDTYVVEVDSGESYEAPFLLNATYGSGESDDSKGRGKEKR